MTAVWGMDWDAVCVCVGGGGMWGCFLSVSRSVCRSMRGRVEAPMQGTHMHVSSTHHKHNNGIHTQRPHQAGTDMYAYARTYVLVDLVGDYLV
jgi:hypothetical protein